MLYIDPGTFCMQNVCPTVQVPFIIPKPKSRRSTWKWNNFTKSYNKHAGLTIAWWQRNWQKIKRIVLTADLQLGKKEPVFLGGERAWASVSWTEEDVLHLKARMKGGGIQNTFFPLNLQRPVMHPSSDYSTGILIPINLHTCAQLRWMATKAAVGRVRNKGMSVIWKKEGSRDGSTFITSIFPSSGYLRSILALTSPHDWPFPGHEHKVGISHPTISSNLTPNCVI